jgi:opacity protein-like surface antigen
MKIISSRTALLLLLCAAMARAQSDSAGPAVPVASASPVEADQGQYSRKSVSHLGTLWLRGRGRSVPRGLVGQILSAMQENFRLPRFDDNPLSEGAVRSFVEAAGTTDPGNEELGRLIDTYLAPQILEQVKAQAVERAARLRSQQQLNSMVADKTKTVDITGDQFVSVLNGAWLYIPILDDARVVDGRESVSASLSMTVLWFNLRLDSAGVPHARLVREVKGSGYIMSRRVSGLPAGNAVRFCLQSAAHSCVGELLKETKEIPEFSLSGQVTEANGGSVGLDLGADAGVRVNDRYNLVENVEGKDGSTTSQEVGWVRVSGSADTAAKRPTSARTVSGTPYAGLALREIPLSPWALQAGYEQEGMSLDITQGSLTHSLPGTVMGVRIGAFYTPNLWYGFSAGLGADFLSGSLDNAAVGVSVDQSTIDIRFALRQSLQLYRRLGVYVEPSVSYRMLETSTTGNGWNDVADVQTQTVGWNVQAGLELALLPSLDLRVGAGVCAFQSDLSSDWSPVPTRMDVSDQNTSFGLRNGGPTFSAQLEWAPPALNVNPLDLLIGLIGL